jgi:hypothetical protein
VEAVDVKALKMYDRQDICCLLWLWVSWVIGIAVVGGVLMAVLDLS